ncbi:MAG: hydroxyacylglutathione hydrolase [Paracoccaceae bacterium]
MALEILTIPCLSDNYAFLAHDPATGTVALVDAPEAGPVQAALSRRGWTLDLILLTHHHHDHVGGVAELRESQGARVVGAKADTHRLPRLDTAVAEGDQVPVGESAGVVIDVSGHTLGHIAFHFPDSRAVFTGDSLMAMGCGRVFEGTPGQMWRSLRKLMDLPPDTLVYSGHEYAAANARFAVTVDSANPRLAERIAGIESARAAAEPTVPSVLAEELATNPFLRARDADMKAALGMAEKADAEVFAEIRGRKDRF